MRIATIVSLAASAVLGVGALVVAKVALPNAAAARNPALAAGPVAGSPIVVASRAIKYGEKLDPAMLTVLKVPANAVPEGSYTAVAQVLAADHGGAPVALFPMSQREPVLPTKLSGPGARPTVAAEIAEGMRAYTIKVSDVSGVGGHALPGDHVDVVLMRDLTPSGDQRNFISYVVLQNVRVLGVDLNADLKSEKPASPSTATLEVSVEDAQKLSVASTLGTLSLALRRTGAAELDEAPPLRSTDFLVGGKAPAGSRVASAGPPRAPNYSAILIIEGPAAKRARAPRKPVALTAPAPTLNGGATTAPTPQASGQGANG
jgi:pilus assembly protein CpaB